MIEIHHDGVNFSFPHLANDAVAGVLFWRLLRSPAIAAPRDRLLPWGRGLMPRGVAPMRLARVDLHADKLPESVLQRGGAILPMWQSEALSIRFACHAGTMPFAVTLESGGVDLVSGGLARAGLNRDPQDYVAFPRPRGLDWVRTGPNTIRQLVPPPIETDLPAEKQLDRSAASGGIRISVTPLTPEAFADWEKNRREEYYADELANIGDGGHAFSASLIEPDSRPLDHYDTARTLSVWVTILDAVAWYDVADRLPRRWPLMKCAYDDGQPWFDHYETDLHRIGEINPEQLMLGMLDLMGLELGLVEDNDGDILPSNLSFMELVRDLFN